MATTIEQQPTPMAATQQAYTPHADRGSVGPVIAVLAVITVLGVLAAMVGRLCSGRSIAGHGRFDFEGWIGEKCSACLDGSVRPPAVRQSESSPSGSPPREGAKQDERTQQQSHHHQTAGSSGS